MLIKLAIVSALVMALSGYMITARAGSMRGQPFATGSHVADPDELRVMVPTSGKGSRGSRGGSRASASNASAYLHTSKGSTVYIGHAGGLATARSVKP